MGMQLLVRQAFRNWRQNRIRECCSEACAVDPGVRCSGEILIDDRCRTEFFPKNQPTDASDGLARSISSCALDIVADVPMHRSFCSLTRRSFTRRTSIATSAP